VVEMADSSLAENANCHSTPAGKRHRLHGTVVPAIVWILANLFDDLWGRDRFEMLEGIIVRLGQLGLRRRRHKEAKIIGAGNEACPADEMLRLRFRVPDDDGAL